MTTQFSEIQEKRTFFRSVTFPLSSQTQARIPSHWHEPALDLFPKPIPLPPVVPAIPKLYLVPTPDFLEGEEEEDDPECRPQPTRLIDLPPLADWVEKYLVSIIEIWAGRRSIQQVARWSHRHVYSHLTKEIGQFKDAPKIRKIYINEPIESVAEITVTLRFGDRVRALILRFEGVDKRWLCTHLQLL
ncbi:MAG: hypothetical protein RL414_959 [Actinomycetota bacterium]|jgi:hypothetical protein